MKAKHLFRVFAFFTILVSLIGNSQPALAASGGGAVIIVRSLSYWNATFIGYVDSSLYEQWPFTLTEPHSFVVNAAPSSAGFTPLIILLDANGSEIARAPGTLTSNQPAGDYSVQIQPEEGAGFYQLSLRQVDQEPASVTTVVNPASIDVGSTTDVSVNLAGVPNDGFASTEFTCTYDGNLGQVSNVVASGLFGSDPAVAVHGPDNGTFIVAIAGSDGSKATTSGTAFTFNVQGLQAGQTTLDCKARVSRGDNTLTDIPSTPADLTVLGTTPTPTATVPSLTPVPPSETPTASAMPPTPTATPPATTATLTGQVMASKPVTVSLYNGDASLAASVQANADGSFSLTAPGGTYTVVARADGFLSAQGAVSLVSGQAASMPVISLPAGDIDGNGVIDQYDAMTIGMSYNTPVPAAADLNNDGIINVLDLELLAQNFRKAGALAWQ